jgi:hypothetical protein
MSNQTLPPLSLSIVHSQDRKRTRTPSDCSCDSAGLCSCSDGDEDSNEDSNEESNSKEDKVCALCEIKDKAVKKGNHCIDCRNFLRHGRKKRGGLRMAYDGMFFPETKP